MISCKNIYVPLMLLASIGAVNAAQLPGNTPVCITSSSAKKMYGYLDSQQQEFAQDLFNSAACYYHKGVEDVFLVKTVGELTQVELKSGFKVWVREAEVQHVNSAAAAQVSE